MPAPDSVPDGQVLYSVFLPPNVTPDPTAGGAHTFFSHDGKNVHYAWIGYGTLGGITNTFSHEFAEACTDPEGSTFAFHADAAPGSSGWIEIGDVCEGYNGVLNGVNVQAYWSQKDRACIIPTLNIPQVPRWYLLGDSEASHGILNGGLVTSADANGILQLFIRGGAGDICHLGQTGSTTWGVGPDAPGHFLSLGGYALPDAFSVAQNPDGRLEMVAIGNGNQVSHAWQVSPGGPWNTWNPLSGQGLGVPRIVLNSAGQLEVFLVGTDSQIWHIKQTAALNWGGIWSPLGAKVATGLFVPPIMNVIANADGRLEVFYQGKDAGLWHLWQISPNGAWAQPARIGGTISLLTLARGHDGIITAFVRAAGDGGLYYIRQTAAPDWGGRFTWITGGVSGSSLTAGINEGIHMTGRIEVFYVGTGSDVRHVWQTDVATPTVWASGSLGGSGIQKVHAANNADGRFELLAIASDSRPWHIWQTAPGNGWNY